jgi:hypothetical protein
VKGGVRGGSAAMNHCAECIQHRDWVQIIYPSTGEDMKKLKLISAVIVVLFTTATFSLAGTEEFCAEKWPKDYIKRNHSQ